MNRRDALTLLGGAALLRAAPVRAAARKVVVYKSPSCGCCGHWVDHMRAAGFDVTVDETVGPAVQRKRLGIADAYASCHTAMVDGYALEGHVPAQDVLRLLRERPAAIGLAVPRMVPGSPGMETPDGQKAPYDVLLLDRAGGSRIFNHYT